MPKIEKTELSNVHIGCSVLYIPIHALGDMLHPDCETGFINSFNEQGVFVRYIRNGILQATPELTAFDDLIFM